MAKKVQLRSIVCRVGLIPFLGCWAEDCDPFILSQLEGRVAVLSYRCYLRKPVFFSFPRDLLIHYQIGEFYFHLFAINFKRINGQGYKDRQCHLLKNKTLSYNSRKLYNLILIILPWRTEVPQCCFTLIGFVLLCIKTCFLRFCSCQGLHSTLICPDRKGILISHHLESSFQIMKLQRYDILTGGKYNVMVIFTFSTFLYHNIVTSCLYFCFFYLLTVLSLSPKTPTINTVSEHSKRNQYQKNLCVITILILFIYFIVFSQF